MQCLINTSNAAHATKQSEKKDLLSHLSDPPHMKTTNTGTSGESTCHFLTKLHDKEKCVLNKHDGCTHCCRFYAGHHAKDCPMTMNNTWPDVETYVPLTLEIVLASKPGTLTSCLPAAAVMSSLVEACNDETDLYVDISPLTVPHLVATLDVFGPNISEFPLPISALLDNGCPSTVISSALVKQLGLHQYPLPPTEDNLLSLSESPLPCKEYVRIELSSGNGGWKSTVFRVKVNLGLPVPLIHGMPFLSSQYIVVDANTCTAKDK